MNSKQQFLDLVEKQRKEHPDDFECKFCGMCYPSDPRDKSKPLGYPYYIIVVRNMRTLEDFKKHIICKDCYDRLKEI